MKAAGGESNPSEDCALGGLTEFLRLHAGPTSGPARLRSTYLQQQLTSPIRNR